MMTEAKTVSGAPYEPNPPASPANPPQAREALWWIGLLAFGAAATVAVRLSDTDLGTRALPFLGHWEPRLTPAVVAPAAVAAAVLVGSRTTILRQLRWSSLLLLGYLASLAWTLALAVAAGHGADSGSANPLALPADLLATVASIDGDPRAYLDHLTGPGTASNGTAGNGTSGNGTAGNGVAGNGVAGLPPGPVLLLWAATRLGVNDAVGLGLLLTALGAATVPLVVVAVRSLCHETAARRLVPVLALAPWAAWTAASPDAVTATVAAAGVAVGVVGCEPGRRPVWALASGLLLGATGLFGLPAPWLGIAVAATYFVRRRPLLNAVTGAGALIGLFALYAAGFSWPEYLGAARAAGLAGSGWPTWVAWCVLDLVVVVAVAGPVLVRAAARIRLTPGWPFLVGAGAMALFSFAASLAHGGVELSWLPLLPWLLVPALAPQPRPAEPGDTVRAGDVPLLLVALGAAAAVVLGVCLVPA